MFKFSLSLNFIFVVFLSAISAVFSVVTFSAEEKSKGAFVYTELQISVPFNQVPWKKVNENIKQQPGFINKTWLSGAGNSSAGGFYVFDSVENAKKFVTDYFPREARGFGVAQTTRVFDIEKTVEASTDINSIYFGGKNAVEPGAFVYTELQSNLETFGNGRWKLVNDKLRHQQGLLGKTWLYGNETGTPGGFYAFDTLENAKKFAVEYFPGQAANLGVAFYTRVFDATQTRLASADMGSPYYEVK